MNFHLKKAGYEKEVTNFSSDLKVRDKFVKIQSQWKFKYMLLLQDVTAVFSYSCVILFQGCAETFWIKASSYLVFYSICYTDFQSFI
ncbi:hypothetical protein DCAR_0520478 [Daucus carota subsp. sativus]|uniref:Uncharacterized protein n=1 Tax=Daucus carota subsp. sativus TaxID=79200 RepID=A0AAF0X3V9_DAUCS|nr:hypothetical protein DCAR_0520478 [Daucus carota subsp. sativus]